MEPLSTQNQTRPFQKISYYSVLVAVSLVFMASAYMKLTDAETVVNNFSKWNLTAWKNTIAWVEITGAVLLLIPKTNFSASALLSGVLAGAIFTHIKHHEPFYFPLAILLVIWICYLYLKLKKIKV
ncbi:MAG: DoxX family protein [Bacteroidetes bacterium]|nr:DoxX family protein [Bacteroidota bacterium]